MSRKDESGSAFPVSRVIEQLHPADEIALRQIERLNGVTRRQWLAGLAMQGLLGNPTYRIARILAEESYLIADALLAYEQEESK